MWTVASITVKRVRKRVWDTSVMYVKQLTNSQWIITSRSWYNFLWNLQIHCHVYKGLPVDCIWSQINLIHIFLLCFFPKTNFNTVVPSTFFSIKQSRPLRFNDQYFVPIYHFPHICSMLLSSNAHRFGYPSGICWRALIIKLCQKFTSCTIKSKLFHEEIKNRLNWRNSW
jgi:hypothetical protein